jgi:hypothetical protein
LRPLPKYARDHHSKRLEQPGRSEDWGAERVIPGSQLRPGMVRGEQLDAAGPREDSPLQIDGGRVYAPYAPSIDVTSTASDRASMAPRCARSAGSSARSRDWRPRWEATIPASSWAPVTGTGLWRIQDFVSSWPPGMSGSARSADSPCAGRTLDASAATGSARPATPHGSARGADTSTYETMQSCKRSRSRSASNPHRAARRVGTGRGCSTPCCRRAPAPGRAASLRA